MSQEGIAVLVRSDNVSINDVVPEDIPSNTCLPVAQCEGKCEGIQAGRLQMRKKISEAASGGLGVQNRSREGGLHTHAYRPRFPTFSLVQRSKFLLARSGSSKHVFVPFHRFAPDGLRKSVIFLTRHEHIQLPDRRIWRSPAYQPTRERRRLV